MDFEIKIENFRALRRASWSPTGVCLLAGANGSGKTTMLDALQFLRVLFTHGHEAAFAQIGGRYFRSIAVPESEPVVFELRVEDVTWRLRFPMGTNGLLDNFGEDIEGPGASHRHGMFEQWWMLGSEKMTIGDEVRCYAKFLWDRGDAAWMKPLVDFITNVNVYAEYQLNRVRRVESFEGRQRFLHNSGANLWSVLSNWQSAPQRWEHRYEWVMDAIRKTFPDLVTSIEFVDGFPDLYSPGAGREGALPAERAASGLLTGLLHLTAIAGAPHGGLVAFDELENQLHPHAIRSLMRAIRERADDHDLTVVMTTHSPIVMNEFRDEPDQFFVLDRAEQPAAMPVRLTDLKPEDALVQSRLGDLYDQLDFARPGGLPVA